jgi:hypothetical protein
MSKCILRLLCFFVLVIALLMLSALLSSAIPEHFHFVQERPVEVDVSDNVELEQKHTPISTEKSIATPAMTKTTADARHSTGRLLAQKAIQRHLGAEGDKRTCCNAQSFLQEFKLKGKDWGVEKVELVEILRNEVKQWTWMNQLKLKNVIKTYERKQECACACPPHVFA